MDSLRRPDDLWAGCAAFSGVRIPPDQDPVIIWSSTDRSVRLYQFRQFVQHRLAWLATLTQCSRKQPAPRDR